MNKVIIVMRTTDPAIRKKVVDLYLQGVGRNESARILGIGETTVTDIIHAWERGIESQNQSLDGYQAVRELAIACKKNGISVTDFRSNLRLRNFITRLGPDVTESQVEQYIANLSGSPNPQSLIKAAEQIAQISDVPLSELEERIKTRQAELQALEAEKVQMQKGIEEGRKILDAINVDKKAAEDFLELKAEMNRYGIGTGSRSFLNVLHTFQKYGYDPSKIMNAFLELEDIKKLKQETDSKSRALASKMEEVKDQLSFARQMLDLGVGAEDFEQFISWKIAIIECAEAEKLDLRSACWRLTNDLQQWRSIGGLKKNIELLSQQLNMMEIFNAQKQQALQTLLILQNLYGVSIDEIVGLRKILDLARLGREWGGPGLGPGPGVGVGAGAQNTNNGGRGQHHAGYPF
jgi:hypothetical protein